MRHVILSAALLSLSACAYTTTSEVRPSTADTPAQVCTTRHVKVLFFFKSNTTNCEAAPEKAAAK